MSFAPEPPIRVLLVDPRQLWRDCLSVALGAQSEVHLVGEAATLEEALAALRRDPVDVVLIQIALPDPGALTLTSMITREYQAREARVVILGVAPSDVLTLRCIEAGAFGCVPESACLSELVCVLGEVRHGGAHYSPARTLDAFQRLAELAEVRRRLTSFESLPLGPRELDILRLVAEGISTQGIAKQLFLSKKTIKNHIHNILRKVGAGDRDAAVLTARRNHWLTDPSRSPCGLSRGPESDPWPRARRSDFGEDGT